MEKGRTTLALDLDANKNLEILCALNYSTKKKMLAELIWNEMKKMLFMSDEELAKKNYPSYTKSLIKSELEKR